MATRIDNIPDIEVASDLIRELHSQDDLPPAYQLSPIHMLLTVAERGFANKIVKLYRSMNVHAHHIIAGHGSASSDILERLGIGSSEKDIIISFATENTMSALLHRLSGDLGHHMGFRGIAIAIRFDGMNRLAAIALSMAEENSQDNNGGGIMMENNIDKKDSLILITVDFGYTDDVMTCARTHGATGGTIMRSRWVGSEEIERIHGFSIQKEREMIMIVADSEKRDLIMDAINRDFGMKTKAHAIICALPVERSILLS